jgi:DNA-binding transcriptional ArsR family regulator
MDLRTALEDATERLAEAEKELQVLTAKIGQLRDEKRGLEFALARHEPQTSGLRAVNEWEIMPRTSAIARLLGQVDGALSPAELAKELSARGRDDRSSVVSAALAYLKNKGLVESVGHGKWRLVRSESNGQTTEANLLTS